MLVLLCAGHLSEPIVSFDAIDWQRPWLAPFKATGQQLIQSGDWLHAANQIAHQQDLRTASDRRVVFMPQHSFAANVSYEAHIHASGEVPTRDNLHDFFNTLAWLRFPRIKRALNALHAASQRRQSDAGGVGDAGRVGDAGDVDDVDDVDDKGVVDGNSGNSGNSGSSSARGRARDAATLFDENAALFLCSDLSSAEALRQHQWASVLQRSPEDFFSSTAVLLFGHALIEKLVKPYKAITAHVWITVVEPDWFALDDENRIIDLDHRVATAISEGFSSADFAHLPVLGVPGWWPAQDTDFYQDASVFRALRQNPRAR